MATSSRFYRRRFLNRRGHHAGAYVIAAVHSDPAPSDTGRRRLSAYLTIGDCGRVVTLDFDVCDLPTAHNALHKARLLRDVVDGFVAAVEAAVIAHPDAARPR